MSGDSLPIYKNIFYFISAYLIKNRTRICFIEKITTFAPRKGPDGEMVDALVSGASVERRVGSSPILGTLKGVFVMKTPFFIPIIWHSMKGSEYSQEAHNETSSIRHSA